MRIGPLEITENGDELSIRYVSRSEIGPSLFGCVSTICLAIGLVVFGGKTVGRIAQTGISIVALGAGCVVVAIVCAALLSMARQKRVVLASRDGRERFVKGEGVPRTAKVRVVSSVNGFTAYVGDTANAGRISLYTFRWRRDAEDLAIAVASFLDLQYVSEPDPIMPTPKPPEDVWPPPPLTVPRQQDETSET